MASLFRPTRATGGSSIHGEEISPRLSSSSTPFKSRYIKKVTVNKVISPSRPRLGFTCGNTSQIVCAATDETLHSGHDVNRSPRPVLRRKHSQAQTRHARKLLRAEITARFQLQHQIT